MTARMEPRFAQRYGDWDVWHWWFRGRRRIIGEILRKELGSASDASIVALGCGPAEGLSWLEPLAEMGGHIVGLDADPAHAVGAQGRVQVVVGDAEAIPMASRTFDVALALDVIEHLDDDALGLGEAVRILRPGGLLVATVPALPSLWGPQDEVSHHRRRYTKASLHAAFARARLPPPRLYYFNSLLLPPVAAVRWVRRALGAADSSRSDFEDNRPGLVNELLAAVFSFERHLLGRIPFPLGVSLLATLRVPERSRADCRER